METNMHTEQSNLRIEEQFLDVPQAFNSLQALKKNINLENEEKIQRLIRLYPKSSSIEQLDNGDDKQKISSLELECERYRTQLQLQIKENERIRQEVEHLKEQILNQSTYCASLGAVLGNLTWRASRFPQIIDIWLSGFQHKIGEFLSIADGSFLAFISTYGNSFPPTSNVEYQFIIGLLGIVTNISSSPEGREFFITNPNGKDFVQKIIKLMPTLPLSQGSLSLKRLMLMILYNVSMNKTGLQHLFESQVGDVLSYYLENNSVPEEIHLLCLRVLQSITYGLNNPKYIQDLIMSIPIAKVEEIASLNNNGVSTIAKQVMKQLREAQTFLHTN